jgi:hypothetical protein
VDGADEITVERVPSATDDVRSLVAELDRILSAEYPPEQRHGLAPDAIFRPSIRFFAARVHGVAEGCGGVELVRGICRSKPHVSPRSHPAGAAWPRQYSRESRRKRAAPDWFCFASKRVCAKSRRSVSTSGRGFEFGRHSVFTPQCRRKSSRQAFFFKQLELPATRGPGPGSWTSEPAVPPNRSDIPE